MYSHTCSVRGRAVSQLVANHAGEVTTNGIHGYNQHVSNLGDFSHLLGDGSSLVQPAEDGVCPPRLVANQQGVRHIDADGDMMNCLCTDTETVMRSKIMTGK